MTIGRIPACPRSAAAVRPVDTEGCDEDVHHHDDKNQAGGQVFHHVQPPMLRLIIQVPSDCGQNQATRLYNAHLMNLTSALCFNLGTQPSPDRRFTIDH